MILINLCLLDPYVQCRNKFQETLKKNITVNNKFAVLFFKRSAKYWQT